MGAARRIDLTIALPAYREADSLRTVLPALLSELQVNGIEAEILVIDSPTPLDDTASVCDAVGVRHIARFGGERYGDAVRSAIATCSTPWLLFMDADGSHPPAAATALWLGRKDADVVIGSRYVEGGGTENSIVLVAMSLALNAAFRFLFSLKTKDVTNSLRLYRSEALKALTLESNNFDVLQEILIKLSARRPRYIIEEMPMSFLPRKAGESKRKLVPFLIDYARTVRRLWRFRASAAA